MAVAGAQQSITQTLLTWEYIQVAPHRFGGVEYRLGRRELGHIHGDHMLDIPFPKRCAMRWWQTGMPARTTFCRKPVG